MHGARPDTASARVVARLSHPVVDCDGHWTEPFPVFAQFVAKAGGDQGSAALDAFVACCSADGWYQLSPAERLRRRSPRRGFWGTPPGTLDRATAMMPALIRERLDEFGVDFAVMLSTHQLSILKIPDPALRRIVVRAMNLMQAELFAPFVDRMTPAATIPTNTPEEAIEEAEYVVRELGLKVAVVNGSVKRPVPAFADGKAPASAPYYVDNLVLDSAHDYDPLWAKLVELRLAPMTHSSSNGWADRTSPSNFVFNHVGHFAQASNSFARQGVLLAGVVRRFPTLHFAFLEGGVGWARVLCSDLLEHLETRNVEVLTQRYKPSTVDWDQFVGLVDRYGGEWLAGRADELATTVDVAYPGRSLGELAERERDDELDDFAAAGVSTKEELAAEFAKNFYFGCEADDRMTALAFDTRLGPKLRPCFGSDIGHFDVPDMTMVLAEAYELVTRGLLDEQQFREFTFSNAVSLHGGMNPGFFDGTVVQAEASEELRRMDVLGAG